MDRPWSRYLPEADPGRIAAALIDADPGRRDLWMLLLAESGAPDLEHLIATLRGAGVRFFGGLFPEVLDGRERHSRGAVLVRLSADGTVHAIPDLVQPEGALERLSLEVEEARATRPTAILLVDFLSPGISRLLRAIYDRLGDSVSYWGGGAGSLSLAPRPYLFTAGGTVQGGAILALTGLGSRMGVRHGWRIHSGPFVATRTRGNVIEQLNWRSALDVYLEQLGREGHAGLGPEAVADVTRNHPFGIQHRGQEMLVRDPVDHDGAGGLICVGDVPENAVLSILHGEPDSLIASAREAAHDAQPPRGSAPRCCLIADCVTRVHFLGKRFGEELGAVERGLDATIGEASTCGALTLGEISSRNDGGLEFHNKTCVVAVLYEA
jgi:hypothetical protein